MFPEERQKRLDPILARIRELPGLAVVHQDDFDSQCINVWIDLQPKDQDPGGPVFRFELPPRTLRRHLRQLFVEFGTDYRVTDYPVMRSEYISVHDRSPGEPSRRKIGYDQTRFGLTVYV